MILLSDMRLMYYVLSGVGRDIMCITMTMLEGTGKTVVV